MTLQEYLRKKQIKEEAEKAAKESAQRILNELWSKSLERDVAIDISKNIFELF